MTTAVYMGGRALCGGLPLNISGLGEGRAMSDMTTDTHAGSRCSAGGDASPGLASWSLQGGTKERQSHCCLAFSWGRALKASPAPACLAALSLMHGAGGWQGLGAAQPAPRTDIPQLMTF